MSSTSSICSIRTGLSSPVPEVTEMIMCAGELANPVSQQHCPQCGAVKYKNSYCPVLDLVTRTIAKIAAHIFRKYLLRLHGIDVLTSETVKIS